MTAEVIVFPLIYRVGKIRAVATTLMGMRSEMSSRAYRHRITAGLLSHMGKMGMPAIEQSEPVFEFWRAVHDEIAKRIEGAA